MLFETASEYWLPQCATTPAMNGCTSGYPGSVSVALVPAEAQLGIRSHTKHARSPSPPDGVAGVHLPLTSCRPSSQLGILVMIGQAWAPWCHMAGERTFPATRPDMRKMVIQASREVLYLRSQFITNYHLEFLNMKPSSGAERALRCRHGPVDPPAASTCRRARSPTTAYPRPVARPRWSAARARRLDPDRCRG